MVVYSEGYVDFRQLSNEHVRRELGMRVRKIRKSRRLNQAQVAELAGLSRPTVSTFERGNDVSLDSFLSILRALDLLDALDGAISEPGVSPIAELNNSPGTQRSTQQAGASVWTWGDETGDAS